MKKYTTFFNHATILMFLLLSLFTTLSLSQRTRLGFYSGTCNQVESIVKATVKKHFDTNPTIAAGLLRMIFHDCFVNGCDASILIDGLNTEKTAGPNRLLKGYEVIQDAKTQLETVCPGVVSCADILAIAARDSVVVTGGIGWLVPTGRRDGRISLASDTTNLPGFTDSVDLQKQKFQAKGLSPQDLVALVGGHTIGTSACQFFSYRLYNFNNSGAPDPTIDGTFLPQLQSFCPQNGDASTRVGLDNGSENRFEADYYSKIRDGRGILESDQMLWNDASTRVLVQRFLGVRGLGGLSFNIEFGRSMIKMSNVEVKTGTAGEIRKVCSSIN